MALQRQMVEQGLLGRKSGAGFYAYREGKHDRFEPTLEPASDERNADERVAIAGFWRLAEDFGIAAEARYTIVERIANDDMLDGISPDATLVVDAGDGVTDRGDVIAQLDGTFGPETLLFADAYATDLTACARHLRHPERLIGYGVLASLAEQTAVEIVDGEQTSDDALDMAQEFFAQLGKAVVLVEDVPGLFLGRTVGGIVNEAMLAIAEGVASPDDVDAALRLGANYPLGPIAWGRAIGGARVSRILKRLAAAEGEAFAPHRSLWVLDAEEPAAAEAAQ